MEERLAAKWSEMSYSEYQALPGADRWIDEESGGDSKASVLVAYRIAMRIEAIHNHIDKPKKKGRK